MSVMNNACSCANAPGASHLGEINTGDQEAMTADTRGRAPRRVRRTARARANKPTNSSRHAPQPSMCQN